LEPTTNFLATEAEFLQATAEAELRAERQREAIDAIKDRLRARRWYHSLFPWRVTLHITKVD
jgi:hypothetical protein